MIKKSPKVTLDGTTGGLVPINPNSENIQLSVSGRATGTLTFTGKSAGSDVYEAFQPALTLDLSVERTAVIEGYSLESLSVAVSVGGSAFSVTVTQWNSQ